MLEKLKYPKVKKISIMFEMKNIQRGVKRGLIFILITGFIHITPREIFILGFNYRPPSSELTARDGE